MAFAGYAHLDPTSGRVPVIEASGMAMLGSVTGIDLKTTAQTTLYTVPAGKTLILTDVILVVSAADTFLTPATIRIGKTAAFTEWLAATALTDLDTVGEFISLAGVSVGLIHQAFAAGEVVKLDVTIGAGATALTVTAVPIGFLV